jgi:hypothetical protein
MTLPGISLVFSMTYIIGGLLKWMIFLMNTCLDGIRSLSPTCLFDRLTITSQSPSTLTQHQPLRVPRGELIVLLAATPQQLSSPVTISCLHPRPHLVNLPQHNRLRLSPSPSPQGSKSSSGISTLRNMPNLSWAHPFPPVCLPSPAVLHFDLPSLCLQYILAG